MSLSLRLGGRGHARVVRTRAGKGFGRSTKPVDTTKAKKDEQRPQWEITKGSCPCASGQPFKDCCEPFIRGVRDPETPEQLMRSRFSAYALQLSADYIVETTHFDNPAMGGTVHNGQQKSTLKADVLATMDKTKYLKLQVLESSPVDSASMEGSVKFRAWFKWTKQRLGGQRDSKMPVQTMTEHSKFVRVDGRWLYRGVIESDYTAHTYGPPVDP